MVYALHIYNEAYLRTLNRLGPCFMSGQRLTSGAICNGCCGRLSVDKPLLSSVSTFFQEILVDCAVLWWHFCCAGHCRWNEIDWDVTFPQF
jgi:hypothetical protein